MTRWREPDTPPLVNDRSYGWLDSVGRKAQRALDLYDQLSERYEARFAELEARIAQLEAER